MIWENLFASTQSVLTASELHEDEESVSSSFWDSQSTRCLNLCAELHSLLESIDGTITPPVQVLIFIGGVLGNLFTSEKLHKQPQLELGCYTLLGLLKEVCGCQNPRDLLLSQPLPSSQPRAQTLALQFLRLCTAQISRAPSHEHEEALNFRPFFRDALLWMAEQLDYPEMAGEEFISVLQPFGLRLCSDYRPQVQLAGLRLLENLSHKARVADWRQSNRAEAVINQLFERHVGCNSAASVAVLHQTYTTLFALIELLESNKEQLWWKKVAGRLLCDIVMEGKKRKLTVLLHHMLSLIQLMKADFFGHSRQFLYAVSVVLLGPRTPNYLRNTLSDEAKDETVHLLMLQCLRHFVRFHWPFVCPGLLPLLLPSLIGFVALEHPPNSPNQADSDSTAMDSACADELFEIFSMLIELEPRVLSNVLLPLCNEIPELVHYLPTPSD